MCVITKGHINIIILPLLHPTPKMLKCSVCNNIIANISGKCEGYNDQSQWPLMVPHQVSLDVLSIEVGKLYIR